MAVLSASLNRWPSSDRNGTPSCRGSMVSAGFSSTRRRRCVLAFHLISAGCLPVTAVHGRFFACSPPVCASADARLIWGNLSNLPPLAAACLHVLLQFIPAADRTRFFVSRMRQLSFSRPRPCLRVSHDTRRPFFSGVIFFIALPWLCWPNDSSPATVQ